MSAPDPLPSQDVNAQEGGGIEGEAWSAEPGADDFEKEASKIFALWELMPPGDATPSGAESAPETWTTDAPRTGAVATTPGPTPQDAAPIAPAPATAVAAPSPAAVAAVAPAEAAAVPVSATASKARDENGAPCHRHDREPPPATLHIHHDVASLNVSRARSRPVQ